MSTGGVALSVIVPTRNEAGNVDELVRRLGTGLAGLTAEIIFVDDSSDQTPQRVLEVAATRPAHPVRLLHREPGQRPGGLGGAVVAGLQIARGDWAVVMDGDLQHPPELVAALHSTGVTRDVDVVVASRYCGQGAATGLASGLRRAASSGTTFVTKACFPRLLHAVSDPMSGFFAIRRAALDIAELRTMGFKILLEVVVRSGGLRVTELPFTFAARFAGESKASLREGLRFLGHLTRLRLLQGRAGRALGFGLVGLSGVLPNLLATAALDAAGAPYLLAAVLATQIAIGWNFLLAERLVFAGRRQGSGRRRFARFSAVNNADLVVRLPLLALLVGVVGMSPVAGTAITLLVAFLLRFLLTDTLVYEPVRASGGPATGPASVPVAVEAEVAA